MAVNETTIIDVISIDKDRGIILTISDHLAWADCETHLAMLKEKINTYCQYVESGQLYDEYPNFRDRLPTIYLVLFHDPPADGVEFLLAVRELLEKEGLSFEWKCKSNQ
jgi:hypothetical protein